MLSASELHRRGLLQTNAGRHAQARKLFLEAITRHPDANLSARILLSLAHAQFELGSTGEALALCRDALAVDSTSQQVHGLIHSQLGVVHSRAGNAAEALVAFGRGLHLLDESPEPRATALLNRGNVHLQRGDLPRALSDLAAAQQLAAGAGLEVIRAKAEHNLGYTSMLAGEVTEALRHMDRARATLETLSSTYLAVCNQERAEVLVAAGMVTEAEDAFRAAARAYGARGLTQRQGEAELVLARLMLRGNPVEAGRVAGRAARRFRSRGSETWALRADLVSVSSAVATKRWSALTPESDGLRDGLARHGLAKDAKVADLQCVSADVQRGRLDEAVRRVARVRISKHDPLATRLLDREVRASLARMKGRRADAVHHLRRGLAELHDWQSTFGSLDLQSSLVGHGRGLALQGLSLAVDDGRPEVVFEWSERARALASRVTPVRPPANEQAARDLASLRQLQIEIRAADVRGSAAASLSQRAAELSGRIRQRSWYDAGSGLVTEPDALEVVSAELDEVGGVLLSYLVVEGMVHVLAAAGGSATVLCLGTLGDVRTFLDGMQADLDMAASDLPAGMTTAVDRALAQRLRLLDDLLVGPLRPIAADRPAVIVPSGALAGVPWTLLPGLRDRPLTVPRSASSWLRAGRDRETGDEAAAGLLAGFVAGPRVERAVEEVSRGSSVWSHSTVLVGYDARASSVSQLASRVDVFHVAAHGRHSADNPLFSGLELADGPWFGYDIDQLDAIPSTVVLSACEVGRSSVRWGEETIGMTVAWLHAGARCVLASPASVNDDVACEVLTATHARLAAGSAPSVALADATRDLGSGSPAPFICYGTGW